ncbi:YtxH domain-containing protein [Pontibacter ruber]|uniref:YtxH domain-containing protein n=1 Tax=Pontibacter ruber TaxID=1343895 RepID=A0ABW5D1L4_9BACT|nr:YtxH domain-containing protein [Pontibacter ruber]
MKTRMDYRSLGEDKATYSNTNSSVRQVRQKESTGYESSRGRIGSSSRSGSTGGGVGAVAVSLLAGAGVGVLAGMLMAPQKGQVTRRRVADSASWLGRGITDAFSTSKNKVNSWTSRSKNANRSASAEQNGQSGTSANRGR